MKRTKTIIADDGNTRATITIKLNNNGSLCRFETDSAIEALTSSIMSIVPDMRYIGVRLSELKVK